MMALVPSFFSTRGDEQEKEPAPVSCDWAICQTPLRLLWPGESCKASKLQFEAQQTSSCKIVIFFFSVWKNRTKVLPSIGQMNVD